MIFLASSSTRFTELQKMMDWLICSCTRHTTTVRTLPLLPHLLETALMVLSLYY